MGESGRDAVTTNALRHDLDLSPDHHTAPDAHMPEAVDKSLVKAKDGTAESEKSTKIRVISHLRARIGYDDAFNDPLGYRKSILSHRNEHPS